MKLKTYPKNWRKVKDDFYSEDVNITFGSLTVDYYSDSWLCLHEFGEFYFVFPVAFKIDWSTVHYDTIFTAHRQCIIGVSTNPGEMGKNAQLVYNNAYVLSEGIIMKERINEYEINDKIIENYLSKEML